VKPLAAPPKETHARSIVKSVTFRVLVISSDLTLIYLLTHKIETTVAIVVVSNIASTIWYYLHERVWNRIGWGRK